MMMTLGYRDSHREHSSRSTHLKPFLFGATTPVQEIRTTSSQPQQTTQQDNKAQKYQDKNKKQNKRKEKINRKRGLYTLNIIGSLFCVTFLYHLLK